mmetsp:Transcript_25220/g.47661  ORF Transcript_25220/g.47661 Transcript_25220/m.47661 type:complete len:268 (-) Transcript_25220:402-1205(-)|eukprot:CAMPEP_0114231224 /NCGR_PEP_ID=MMETSP0058-20121206/3918_1 /TAXON_ID=36894 /ORGANISM="Pyramimonas parkeae, CCMP726" /LENGTH=267 /DNA_ID=CAMNT_0001342535 /DNA_START=253 /DNA_END=1056 /DNA_ORIENTATION=-
MRGKKTSGVITRAVSFALSYFLATTPTRATHLNGDMGGGVYVNIGQELMISHLSEQFGVCHGAQAAGVQATSFGDVLGSARFLLLEKSYVNCAGCKQAAPWWAAFASRIPSWCNGTVFAATLLWRGRDDMTCDTWAELAGDAAKDEIILEDPDNKGVAWFGESRPMYYLFAPNGTVMYRKATVWNGNNDIGPELEESLIRSGAPCQVGLASIEDEPGTSPTSGTASPTPAQEPSANLNSTGAAGSPAAALLSFMLALMPFALAVLGA